jgi:Ca2+-binding EF-hand superfamily protein
MLGKDGDGKISQQEWSNGFEAFDLDKDCSITKSEFHIVSRSGFIFEMLDADGDGQITLKEYNTGFDLLDRDKDGFLSRQGFGNIPTEHFRLLDKDKDGQLSRAEYESGFALMDIGERFLFPTAHVLLRGSHHSTRVPPQGVYSAVAFTMKNRDPLLVGAPIRITSETGTGGGRLGWA